MAEILAAQPAADQTRKKGAPVRISSYAKLFDSAFQFLLCLFKNLPAYDRIVAVFYKVLRQLPRFFTFFLLMWSRR